MSSDLKNLRIDFVKLIKIRKNKTFFRQASIRSFRFLCFVKNIATRLFMICHKVTCRQSNSLFTVSDFKNIFWRYSFIRHYVIYKLSSHRPCESNSRNLNRCRSEHKNFISCTFCVSVKVKKYVYLLFINNFSSLKVIWN